MNIGVSGPHSCNDEERELGFRVGAAIAGAGHILVCGGMGGMMEAAAEGARKSGGTTVGILPGDRREDANRFIDVALPTGLGPFRNALVVQACDAVIAIRGGYGTLSEIAFALRLGVPVVGLNTWAATQDGKTDPGIHVVSSPEEAVDTAIRLARRSADSPSHND
ncbi:MAG: TIGR00725 family protein [Verrucomicrobia bacterium]|nr:TIGR00725 family protein [Verrucomicrobiota bacterium]